MCGYPIMASYHPIDLDDIPIMPLYYIGQGTTCFYPSWAILEENKVFFNCCSIYVGSLSVHNWGLFGPNSLEKESYVQD